MFAWACPWSGAMKRARLQRVRAQVIDYRNESNNRFLAVRELKIQGTRVPHYNRRAEPRLFR